MQKWAAKILHRALKLEGQFNNCQRLVGWVIMALLTQTRSYCTSKVIIQYQYLPTFHCLISVTDCNKASGKQTDPNEHFISSLVQFSRTSDMEHIWITDNRLQMYPLPMKICLQLFSEILLRERMKGTRNPRTSTTLLCWQTICSQFFCKVTKFGTQCLGLQCDKFHFCQRFMYKNVKWAQIFRRNTTEQRTRI